MKNICKVLSEVAAKYPDQVALVDRHRGRRRELRFSELDEATAFGAQQLSEFGLEVGDTVLFLHPVSIELYTALLSVFKAGMTAMFVDPSVGREGIEACCQLRQPQGFFGSPKAHLLRLFSRSIRRAPVKMHSGSCFLPGSRRWHPAGDGWAEVVDGAEVPALITFTSGSTGEPKGVARSHEFLIAQHRALENALGLVGGETDLITLPVFALANLGSGLTSVLADTDLAKPGEADAVAVARQIFEESVSRVAASPAFFEAMLEQPESLSRLKRIATGGAPVFPPLLDRLAEAAPEAEVFAVYGSTEAEPIAHVERGEILAEDLERMKAGGGLLVGKPVDEIDLRILPDQFGTPVFEDPGDLPVGEIGEIVVSGEHVLDGYLDGVGDDETKFRVGDRVWHRTGDAGALDESGRLWLMGRCTAKLGGGEVYPFSVECALSFVSGLRRSAVTEFRGERLLVVEVEGEDVLEGIRAGEIAAKFDRVVRVEKIPVDRRHQAKVDYPALRELLEKLAD